MKYLFNEKGGKPLIITVIILCVFFFISGGAIVYFTIKDKNVEFSEETVAEATKVAQSELDKAFAVAKEYPFEKRFEAIQSIGYGEPEEGQFAVFTFEKKYEKDDPFYVILKMKPHAEYENLSVVQVAVFDKKNGALIVEKENVLRWEKKEQDS
ncbi:hypothetical protein [Ureibacillus terrenus]|uniref:Uncharacterized protein n=1 Tax=Ureibacillus terrenus TaxID=118246 RepID=A0A540V6S1_9BACL|nr:hypothetical protein [Ureibacillus terrenus]MED3660509.1 hypothetical protein [Ureibacillus terrenus]MED3762662.1 hypothetical protein [Ureibacillus terrenus]TQE92460.1 hypothetical protein FKZ59_01760 [Ureibacillus terrenus]